jgi:hypothetical protein
MADKWKDDPQDEPMTGVGDERIRGVADDEEEFDATEDLDDEEEDEEGSTF